MIPNRNDKDTRSSLFAPLEDEFTPNQLALIRRIIQEELSIIQTDGMRFNTLGQEPKKVRDGLIAFSDGASFGVDGAGFYIHQDGAWGKIAVV